MTEADIWVPRNFVRDRKASFLLWRLPAVVMVCRLHCYFPGPFLLVMAVASLLYGFGLVSLGGLGWLWIGLVTLVGGIRLTVVTERIWGKYAGGRSATGQSCS